jgi:glycosyltransferase involved in cell wall biosynthesis
VIGITAEQHDGASVPLVVHVFPTFAVGGAQVRFAAIANHFGPAFRHKVVALDGVTACRERLRRDLDLSFPAIEAPKNALFANAWRFRGLIREWRPDMLVTYNWGAIEFALANAVLPVSPHIHVVDGFGPEERAAQIPRRVTLRRIALRRTPVVLPSRNLVRTATEIWKLSPARVRYAPNGVDLRRFSPAEQARGDGAPVIGTIAALREEKQIARLLRAFALLPRVMPARLVVVGDGPQRASLVALATELGIADLVMFAGHQADTPEFYRRFDVFALSSDTEQMPLSVIEAMACGLPVVSTDVGDVRSMVADENVPFVTELNDASLAAGLRSLLADPVLRRRIGAANRTKASRDFDEATMFALHGALWRGTGGPP